ncbi:MAG TPA: DUF1801 domain-containing protein [Edaphocola sp.]|nr:DUF1801 domain-containing protein [Edaphocola sp.]
MKSTAFSIEAYLEQLPEDRKPIIEKLRNTIKDHLPSGFVEEMSYGMIGYVVPHSIYPEGYHCNPSLPLPFISIASQKNFIGFYHMGIYAVPELMQWFTEAYLKENIGKMDAGKSCVRFKKIDKIPYGLLAELAQKMSVKDWIAVYEKNYKK